MPEKYKYFGGIVACRVFCFIFKMYFASIPALNIGVEIIFGGLNNLNLLI